MGEMTVERKMVGASVDMLIKNSKDKYIEILHTEGDYFTIHYSEISVKDGG